MIALGDREYRYQRRKETQPQNKRLCVFQRAIWCVCMIDKTPAYPRVIGRHCCISPSVPLFVHVCVCLIVRVCDGLEQ